MLKVIEVLAQSDRGWEDAVRTAVTSGEDAACVKNNEVVEFRIDAKISFVIESE